MMKLMNQKPVVPPPSAAAPVRHAARCPERGRADDDHRVGRACRHGRAAGRARRRAAGLVRRLPDEGSVPAAGHERGRRRRADAAASGATRDAERARRRARTLRRPRRRRSLDRGAATTTTPATAVPSTPAGAERLPRPPRPSSPLRRPSRSPSTASTSHVARGGAFPSSTPVFRLVSWTKGVGPDRHRRRLLLDRRPDARADARQAGHPAEHEQRPAATSSSCSPRLRGWRPRPKLPIDPVWARSFRHATNPASA